MWCLSDDYYWHILDNYFNLPLLVFVFASLDIVFHQLLYNIAWFYWKLFAVVTKKTVHWAFSEASFTDLFFPAGAGDEEKGKSSIGLWEKEAVG